MCGRGGSKRSRSRKTTISSRYSATSSAMPHAPSWSRRPRIGAGRASRAGFAATRCCGGAKYRCVMSSGWNGSTSRYRPATFDDCGTRSREADHLGASRGRGRRRPVRGWNRACVRGDDHGRRSRESPMLNFDSPCRTTVEKCYVPLCFPMSPFVFRAGSAMSPFVGPLICSRLRDW